MDIFQRDTNPPLVDLVVGWGEYFSARDILLSVISEEEDEAQCVDRVRKELSEFAQGAPIMSPPGRKTHKTKNMATKYITIIQTDKQIYCILFS